MAIYPVYVSRMLCSILTLTLLVSLLWVSSTRAQEIRFAQEHANTEPFQLVITILEKSIAQYGDGTTLHWVDTTNMNQPRALRVLESCNSEFDVFFSGYDIEREQRLLQVDFPLTMGLLGVRGFVTTVDQAKALQGDVTNAGGWLIGSGRGWPDTRIMLENQFQVTQADYENLWAMLNTGRFQVFQRGIQEAQLEIHQRSSGLHLINNLVMLYPLATMLYVNPCKPALKTQLESILQSAYDDGLIQSIIRQDPYASLAIDRLTDPSVRKVVLKNTQVSENFVSMIDRYWLPEIQYLLGHDTPTTTGMLE